MRLRTMTLLDVSQVRHPTMVLDLLGRYVNPRNHRPLCLYFLDSSVLRLLIFPRFLSRGVDIEEGIRFRCPRVTIPQFVFTTMFRVGSRLIEYHDFSVSNPESWMVTSPSDPLRDPRSDLRYPCHYFFLICVGVVLRFDRKLVASWTNLIPLVGGSRTERFLIHFEEVFFYGTSRRGVKIVGVYE